MNPCLLSLFSLVLFSAVVRAADSPADISSLLQPILAKHKTPGLIGAVVNGKNITALGAAGIRKQGSPELFTTNDLIHLGSDTKAMTAILIAQLIQANQLAFTTTMAEIFPDLAPKMNPIMAKITVAQLLHHTAGLATKTTWATFDLGEQDLPHQRQLLAQHLLFSPPATTPGTRFEYSNAGYVLLGAILERKTRKPWEEIIQQRIFDPLEMKSAGFGPPGTPGKTDQPWGHTLLLKSLMPNQFDNPPIISPAGRVHCTISDWAKFISLFLQEQPAIIKQETLRALTTPGPIGNYAGGWITTTRPWGGTVLTHSGSNTFWYCTAWLAPTKNFAVLSATNIAGEDAAAACDDVASALIQWHQSH